MKDLDINIISAEDMRKNQEEIRTNAIWDDNEVISLMEYIGNCLQKYSEYPSIKEIILPRDILIKSTTGSILYVMKLLEEKFKYKVEYSTSKDMERSKITFIIRW